MLLEHNTFAHSLRKLSLLAVNKPKTTLVRALACLDRQTRPPCELANADFFQNSYSLVVEPDSSTHRVCALPKGESQGGRPPVISQERKGARQRRGRCAPIDFRNAQR